MSDFPTHEQNIEEFYQLIDILKAEGVESILEVGVFQGGTLTRFKASFPYATVVGIDPRPMMSRQYAGCPVVLGCSQDRMVRQRAESLNGGEPFDFVFIDGDHSYDGVREDYEWATREARKLVAFHDIRSRESCPDVVRWWNDYRESDGSPTLAWQEICREEHRNGIGVVYLVPPVSMEANAF